MVSSSVPKGHTAPMIMKTASNTMMALFREISESSTRSAPRRCRRLMLSIAGIMKFASNLVRISGRGWVWGWSRTEGVSGRATGAGRSQLLLAAVYVWPLTVHLFPGRLPVLLVLEAKPTFESSLDVSAIILNTSRWNYSDS